jgi:hypothetical protein
MIHHVLGHFAQEPAETEIKYLHIVPLNGDPWIFIPMNEHVFARGTALELQLPIIRTTLQRLRLVGQFTYNKTPDFVEAVQVLGDAYLWQSVASIMGLYVTASRLSDNVQQIVMYGNRMRGNYGPLLENWFGHRFHPSDESDSEQQVSISLTFLLQIFRKKVLQEDFMC